MTTFDGVSGWIAAIAMARMNAAAEYEAVSRLAPAAGDRVLAIGFGPGLGLERLLAHPVTEVIGVDPSAVMHRVARARVGEALVQRRLTLIEDVVERIEPALGPFDGGIAVNTLQICQPVRPTAGRLARLMRPGSRLVSITHAWAAARDYGSIGGFVRSIDEGFRAAGFVEVSQGRAAAEQGKAILIEIIR